MAEIHILPDLLVNKIAAGEVIERPASVVKELLENALDAGAARIQIQILDGGRKLIRIADDGHGISAAQLALAVTPHATSKLSAEDDLYRIQTLGFRGEALASIGSVAHLRILSRPAACPAGAEIYVAGEVIETQQDAHCAPGTTVEVRDLFFNVPARRKFLRSANTEMGHISEQLARVALPRPDVAFELTSGPRTVKRLQAHGDRRQRLAELFGEALAEVLIPVERRERGLSLSGFVAPPAHSRATGKWQYVFVNGRYVRDRLVQHAVRDSFRGLMEPARHAVVFLFLDLDPATLDVNVHPTKIEVRWQDGQAVHAVVRAALREALGAADLTPRFDAGRASSPATDGGAPRPSVEAFFGESLAAAGPPARLVKAGGPPPPTGAGRLAGAAPVLPAATTAAEVQPPPAVQLHRTYLVTETDDGILIIDQHALHERIIYEQLKQRMASGDLESQHLLIPQTVELSPRQLAALEAQPELLGRLGIDGSRFDDATLAVHAFPGLLRPERIPEFMRDLADTLCNRDAPPEPEDLIHRVLDMMACKAAVKAGDPLTPAERHTLIAQRHLVDKGTNCPHGRPTALRFTLADLERQFKRR